MTAAPVVPRIHAGWLSGAAFSGMGGFGIAMALLGAILPLISQRLHFDLAQAGGLFLLMNATMLVGTFVLGPLLDRFGIKLTFVIAPLLVAAALVLVANARSFEGLQVAIVFLAMGGGALNQSTNTLIADLHEDEHRKSSALNLLGVFFGFGALSVPFAIGSLQQRCATVVSTIASRYPTIFLPSIGNEGNCRARPPVAMTIFFASSTCLFPSDAVTSNLPGAINLPLPITTSILFLRMRNCTPLLILSATPRLRLITFPKFCLGDSISIP